MGQKTGLGSHPTAVLDLWTAHLSLVPVGRYSQHPFFAVPVRYERGVFLVVQPFDELIVLLDVGSTLIDALLQFVSCWALRHGLEPGLIASLNPSKLDVLLIRLSYQ